MNRGNWGPGIFCATVGMAAVVTAGFGWTEVLLGWCLGAVLRWLLPNWGRMSGKRVGWIQMLGGVILLCGVLLGAEMAFPEDGTFPFVSLCLLLLWYRTMIGEGKTGNMVANVLGMVMLVLLGVILLFGFSHGNIEEVRPRDFQWNRVWITVVLTSPWWLSHGAWGWYGTGMAVSVGISVLCRYVLGAALTEYASLPLYSTVQTIRFFGGTQRFESLLATAVLLGAYGMLCQIGNVMRIWGEYHLRGVERKCWCAVVLVVVFLLEWGYRALDGAVQTRICTIFWGFTAIYALLVVFSGNMKKVLDKLGNVE